MRNNLDRETPLQIFLGTKIHVKTRSKVLIQAFNRLGLAVSYSRQLQIEDHLASAQCNKFAIEGVAAPSQLRRWATTYGTIDNLDVNPSSTTAKHSFRGTGISIFQVLNEESLERPLAEFPHLDKNMQLPSSYAIVPEYALQTKKVSVVACPLDYDEHCCYEQCMAEEYGWLQTAHTLLSNEIKKTDRISWAAYHAAQGRGNPIPETTEAMLPLFHEKAASPAMMKHGLDVLKGITEFLNPGQVCIMSMDQPLYADAKYV